MLRPAPADTTPGALDLLHDTRHDEVIVAAALAAVAHPTTRKPLVDEFGPRTECDDLVDSEP